jgi:hypothetical protein
LQKYEKIWLIQKKCILCWLRSSHINVRVSFHGTGSYPLPPQGWQRKIRFNVNQNPLKTPCFLNASIPYCEHDGTKRQFFGKNGEIAY